MKRLVVIALLLAAALLGLVAAREPAKPVEREFYLHQFAGYLRSSDVSTTDANYVWLTANDDGTLTIDFNAVSISETDPCWVAWLAGPPNVSEFTNDAGYLTAYSETDPCLVVHNNTFDHNDIADGATAYSWGDHSLAGYLTSYSETDPCLVLHNNAFDHNDIADGATAYGWGDHSLAGYGDMTKAVYDVADDGFVDGNDTVYAASWNGIINAPSMNAVFDAFNLHLAKSAYDVLEDGFVDGNDTAYAASWNGNINAPSMNAVYDAVGGLSGDYLAIDGSNANTTIDIGSEDFVTTGDVNTTNIYLPMTTTGSAGVIFKTIYGDTAFIHNFQHPTGAGAVPSGLNTFVGLGAGNFTMGSLVTTDTYEASYNTGFGAYALAADVNGYYNNAIGSYALYQNTHGYQNNSMGCFSMLANTTGATNNAMGYYALAANISGTGNTAVGQRALDAADASYNTAIGWNAGGRVTSGASGVYIGSLAGNRQTTKSNLLIIDNQDRGSAANELDNSLIHGVFNATSSSQDLRVNADLIVKHFIERSVTATITAVTPGVQGDGALTSEINEVATVANANDAVTMPAAVAGLRIVIINNGVNTLEIWPASGDNLGAGVDTAVTLTAGSNVEYVAYNTTNWEQI